MEPSEANVALEDLEILSPLRTNQLLLSKGPTDYAFQEYRKTSANLTNMAANIRDKRSFISRTILETTLNIGTLGMRTLTELGGIVEEGVNKSIGRYRSVSAEQQQDWSESIKKQSPKPIRYGDILFVSPAHSDISNTGSHSFNIVEGVLVTEAYFMKRSHIAMFRSERDMDQPWLSLFRVIPINKISSGPADGSGSATAGTTVGEVLHQGEAFALQQLCSKAFLCAEPDTFADIERDCIRLGITHNESIYSHFSVRTKFNVRNGGPVYYNDQVVLTNTKMMLDLHMGGPHSQYGTPSIGKFGNAQRIEVNLSQLVGDSRDGVDRGTNSWRFHYYGPVCPAYVCGGDFVRIQHLHINGYLWGSCHAQIFDRPHYSQRQVVGASKSVGSTASSMVHNKPPCFSLNDSKASVSPKTVFVIEKLSMLNGDRVTWNDDLKASENFVRLRHLATGCYLSVTAGSGASTYGVKLSKIAKWGDVDPVAAMSFLYSTLFRFGATTDQHGQFLSWQENTVSIEYARIPPPSAVHLSSVLAAFSAGIVVVEVNGVCVPYVHKGPSAVMSVGSTRPRTKKTPYPCISQTHGEISQEFAAAAVLEAGLPHKAVVMFSYVQKECDVVQLERVPDIDVQMITSGLVIHNYFDINEDSLFLKMASPGSSITASTIAEKSRLFKWHPDSYREMDTVLFTMWRFIRSDPKYNHAKTHGEDSYVENVTALDEASSDTTGKEVRTRNQILVANLSVLDRLFWFLQLPEIVGMTWEDNLQTHSRRLYELTNYGIIAAVWNNPIVQDYVARSSFRGWRAAQFLDGLGSKRPISSHFGNVDRSSISSDNAFKITSIGYLLYINNLMGRSSFAPKMFEHVVMENSSLMNTLICNTFVQDCIFILRRRGPSEAILELLASMAYGAGRAIISNQNMVLDALYATGDNKLFQDNRLGLLVETLYWHDMDKTEKGDHVPLSPIFVSWNGSEGYVLGDNQGSELFFDPDTLQLPNIPCEPQGDLKAYYEKIGFSTAATVKWVNLVDLAWYIDPANCCHFWEADPIVQWSRLKAEMRADPSKLERVSHLQMLSLHCLGVYDVVAKLCSQRSYRPIRSLERQFCYGLCVNTFSETKLPTAFRRVMCDILRNLYVDRHPHAPMVLPFPFRFASFMKSATSMDSALLLICKFNALFSNSLQGAGMEDIVDACGEQITYRDYLMRFQPIVTSTDVDKFKEVQDSIAEYFLGEKSGVAIPSTTKLARLTPQKLRGGSEVDNFRCSLSMLETLHDIVSMGYCNTSYRLMQSSVIAASALISHRIGFASDARGAGSPHNGEHGSEDGGSDSDESSEVRNDNYSGSGEDVPLGGVEALYVSNALEDIVRRESFALADQYLPLTQEYLPERKESPRRASFATAPKKTSNGGDDESGADEIGRDTLVERTSDLPQTIMKRNLERRGFEFTRICQRHDSIKHPDVVIEHVYENQRWFGISYQLESVLTQRGPFSSKNPGLLLIFNHDYTIEDNADTNKGLPDASWMWIDEWHIQTVMKKKNSEEFMRSETSDGWFYAIDWPYELSPKKIFASNVRRRRWERTRRVKTAEEFVDSLLDKGYNRNVLMQVCNNGNISADGVFDFYNILRQLQNIPVENVTVSKNHGNVRVENSLSVELDSEEWLQHLSAKCLAKCLDIFLATTSITLDARVTRAKLIFHTTGPPEKFSTSSCERRDDGTRPLWRLADEPSETNTSALDAHSSSLGRVCLTDEGERALLSLFEQDSTFNLDTDKIIKSVLAVMLDSNHELCDKSISVLRKRYEYMKEFARHFQECIVLTSDEDCAAATELCTIVRTLQNDLPSYFQTAVAPSLTTCIANSIGQLRNCMLQNSSSDGEPCFRLQNIMRKMKGYVPIVQVLLHSIYSRHGCASLLSAKIKGPLWEQAELFLDTFCRDNELNKKTIIPALPLLVKGVNIKFPGYCTLIRIIQMVLCDVNPYHMDIATDEIILSFIRVIAIDKMNCCVVHRITNFLKHMAVPYGQPIRKNQELILNEMLAVSNKYRVELFDVRRYRTDPRAELLSLIDEFSRTQQVSSSLSSPDNQEKLVKDSKLLYHAECIEILALCCHGHRATLSARCQLILPLAMVIEVLSRGTTYTCLPIALAYGLFLRHVYLDTDTDISRMPIGDGVDYLTEFKPMWETCSHFCTFAGDRGNLNGPFRPFVFLVALPCLQMYLSAYINDQTSAVNAVSDDNDGFADMILLQTKRSVARLLREQDLSLREVRAVSRIAAALGVSEGDFEVTRTSNADDLQVENSRPTLLPESSSGVIVATTGMSSDNATSAIEMTEVVGTISKNGKEDPVDSSPMTNRRSAHFASPFRRASASKAAKAHSDEDTEGFIASFATHCPRIKKIIDLEFQSFVDLLFQSANVASDSDESASEFATGVQSRTVSVGSRSEIETVISGSDASSNSLAFCALIKRLIHFAREEIAKQKAEPSSDDDAFRSFGAAYCPLPAKLTKNSEADNSSFEFGEKENAKNIHFILRALTSALRRLREKEEAVEGKNIIGIRVGPTGSTTNTQKGGSFSANTSFADLQLIMARCHAPALIVDILAHTRYAVLTEAALVFGTELYANGNKYCQDTLLDHLDHSKSRSKFMCRLEYMITGLTSQRREVALFRRMTSLEGDTGSSDEVGDQEGSGQNMAQKAPPSRLIYELFRFLQLLCEGHYSRMQEILEVRSGVKTGLLTATVHLLNEYIPSMDDMHQLREEDGAVVYAILNFLVESVQGPCFINQEILASNVMFWEVIDRIWRFSSKRWDIKKEKLHVKVDIKDMLSINGNEPLGFRSLKVLKITAMILRCGLIEGRKPSLTDTVFKVFNAYDMRESSEGLRNINYEYRMVEKAYRKERYRPRKMTKALKFVLEEGYLMFSLVRVTMRTNSKWSDAIIPRQPSAVHRRHFPSEAEYSVALREYKEALRRFELYATISDNLRSVEVTWAGKGLFAVHFVIPWKCRFLSKEMKDSLIASIDYTSDDKVAFFLEQTRTTSLEMTLKMFLEDINLQSLLMFQDELAAAIFSVTMLINFVMVVSLEKGYFTGDHSPQFSALSMHNAMLVLVWIQFLLSLYRSFQHALIRFPLIFEEWRYQRDQMLSTGKSGLTRSRKVQISMTLLAPFFGVLLAAVIINGLLYVRFDELQIPVLLATAAVVFCVLMRSLYAISREPWIVRKTYAGWFIMLADTVMDKELKFDILFLVLAALCLNVDRPYLNSLMLLFVVKQSGTLQNVAKAVTIPIQSLAMSAFLGFICIFIFTVFGFYFMPVEFFNSNQSVDECSTLLLCLATFLHGGFLSGGGIADHITGDLGHELILSDPGWLTARIAYDIAFFVIIIILLLNIIFGIIIDTFGQLREEAAEKADIMASFCFICGISKDVFDARASSGAMGGAGGLNFAGHISTEHNMWDYMFFLIYLQEKDNNDYTGIESYVAKLVQEGDISWVPKGVALGVNDATELESVQTEERLAKHFRDASDRIQATLGSSMQAVAGSQREAYEKMMAVMHKLEMEVASLKRKVDSMP